MEPRERSSECLTAEALFEATVADEPTAATQQHLAGCERCRTQVRRLQDQLAPTRERIHAVADRAVAMTKLPAQLPPQDAPASLRRSVARAFSWRIPAWSLAPVAASLLLVAFWPRPERVVIGPPKEVPTGVSSTELFSRLYAPDLADPGAVRASLVLLEEYAAAHPDDLSARVKLVELYEALLGLRGWEDPLLTREQAQERLAAQRALVQQRLSAMGSDR